MKKFNFSLERVLTYREQQLKDAKAHLARLNKELDDLQKSRENMQAMIVAMNEKSRGTYGEDLSAALLSAGRSYIEGLRADIMMISTQIIHQSNLCETQMRKVVAQSREIQSMEKLKERKKEEYDAAVMKAEELYIEEFVSRDTIIKASQEAAV